MTRKRYSQKRNRSRTKKYRRRSRKISRRRSRRFSRRRIKRTNRKRVMKGGVKCVFPNCNGTVEKGLCMACNKCQICFADVNSLQSFLNTHVKGVPHMRVMEEVPAKGTFEERRSQIERVLGEVEEEKETARIEPQMLQIKLQHIRVDGR